MIEIRRYVRSEAELNWEVVFRATRESNARDYHPDLIERWAPSDMDSKVILGHPAPNFGMTKTLDCGQ